MAGTDPAFGPFCVDVTSITAPLHVWGPDNHADASSSPPALPTSRAPRVPAGSVVISGSLPKDGGKYNLYAAVIVKRVDAQTRAKTSLNDLLRD